MYTHDKFINQAIKIKQNNQTLLITTTKANNWKVPLEITTCNVEAQYTTTTT